MCKCRAKDERKVQSWGGIFVSKSHTVCFAHSGLLLREYAGWVKELPAWAALYRIIGDTGLLPYSAVQEAGANRARTLLKVMEMLQHDAMLASDWHTMAQAISVIRQNKGIETASLYVGKGQAVRIMNVHKAKGLEAPIVFLACPCGEKDHDAEQFIDCSETGASGYFLMEGMEFIRELDVPESDVNLSAA